MREKADFISADRNEQIRITENTRERIKPFSRVLCFTDRNIITPFSKSVNGITLPLTAAVSEGYLWEMVQRGDVDIDQMEKDFTRLMAFWKSVYLRKE